MKEFLKKAVFYLILLLIVVTPLLHTNFTEESYEFPKMLFVYFIAATLSLLYLFYRVFFVPSKKFVFPHIFVSAYVGAVILSTIFSSHIYTSLWGYYSRFNGGLVSALIFYVLYIVCINFLTPQTQKIITIASLIPLVPVTVFGLVQALSVDRISSTLGQPNWLAAYLIMSIPILINFFFEARDKLIKFAAGFLTALVVTAIFLTASISGLLGMVVACTYFFNKVKIKIWQLALGLFILVLVFSQSTFLSARLSDVFTFSSDPSAYKVSDSGLIRAGMWEGSVRLATASTKNFIIGTGPETFPYEFPFFRPVFLNYSSEWDFILNKPHNFYLELLVESGIIGLAAYILIMVNVLKSHNKAVVYSLLGFYTVNFFGWPTVSTELLFWFWLAISLHETNKNT